MNILFGYVRVGDGRGEGGADRESRGLLPWAEYLNKQEKSNETYHVAIALLHELIMWNVCKERNGGRKWQMMECVCERRNYNIQYVVLENN